MIKTYLVLLILVLALSVSGQLAAQDHEEANGWWHVQIVGAQNPDDPNGECLLYDDKTGDPAMLGLMMAEARVYLEILLESDKTYCGGSRLHIRIERCPEGWAC